MKERIAKSVFWMVWSRGGLQLVSFVITITVTRLLSPSDYGLMALATIWTATISMLAEMGLGAAIVQFRDLDKSELSACFWLIMTVAVVGYGTLFLASPSIADWFNTPELTTILRVVGLTLPLIAIRVVPDSLLRKQLRLDKVSQAEILSVMITMPVVLGLALAGAGVWALVAGAIIMPLVQSMATFWFVRWSPTLKIRGRRLREIIHYSAATLGSRLCWALYQQADTLVLGKVCGEAVLGFYTVAKQLATLPVEKATPFVNQLAVPVMAELQGNLEALQATFLKGLRLVTCLAFPMCVGLLLVADDLVAATLSDKWVATVQILRILCIFAATSSIATLLGPVLMARNRVKLQFWYTLIQLFVMPLAFWVGAIVLKGMGVAIAWAIIYPLSLLCLTHFTLTELGLGWQTFWSHLMVASMATMVMAVSVLAVRWMFTQFDLVNPGVRLSVSVVTGVAFYSLALFRLRGPLQREIREVFGWVLGRGTILKSKHA
ncbi:lipopolysaccharide biosynthesis protein [Nitrospira sp. Nam74]